MQQNVISLSRGSWQPPICLNADLSQVIVPQWIGQSKAYYRLPYKLKGGLGFYYGSYRGLLESEFEWRVANLQCLRWAVLVTQPFFAYLLLKNEAVAEKEFAAALASATPVFGEYMAQAAINEKFLYHQYSGDRRILM